MNSEPTTPDQDISIKLPVRIGFEIIEEYLKKKYINTSIGKSDDNGKTSDYFKILDLSIGESHAEAYNLEIKLKLQTLTLLFHDNIINVVMQAHLSFEIETQKLYVESYKIDSMGESKLESIFLNSTLNTLFYKKTLNTLYLELMPMIKKKIDSLNTKLATKLEPSSNISIVGKVENFIIEHFKIKKDEIWMLVHSQGWCIISIEDLDI